MSERLQRFLQPPLRTARLRGPEERCGSLPFRPILYLSSRPWSFRNARSRATPRLDQEEQWSSHQTREERSAAAIFLETRHRVRAGLLLSRQNPEGQSAAAFFRTTQAPLAARWLSARRLAALSQVARSSATLLWARAAVSPSLTRPQLSCKHHASMETGRWDWGGVA